ncbi:transcriptional regulator, TetR family [Paenibacillus algorifonticola]|uniref:Transcriptional regulator, TetR family n=1 Tax=Paenibacillus algorifonticola TaxID=684063 RepID=A0A1I2AIZ5_9BACL|nr:TetR/AcrR family transcriptional regulator [Paenibacillus algorifonticola]SFE43975.1 transcriptional regulator, TetR family [Paenibacillus algorifonticola]
MDTKSQALDKRNKTIQKLIIKIIPVIQKNGFSTLKMDDAAKYMDISKATMYKYFASKDEIIDAIVGRYVDYISEMVQDWSLTDNMSYVKSFDKVFQQSLLMAVYLSDIFLQELGNLYPHLYDRLSNEVEVRNEQVREFFDLGMKNDVFQRLNPVILLIQMDTMLRKMIDPKLLMLHHLSLKQALSDYYQVMRHQIMKSEFINIENSSEMDLFLNQMVQKLSRQ